MGKASHRAMASTGFRYSIVSLILTSLVACGGGGSGGTSSTTSGSPEDGSLLGVSPKTGGTSGTGGTEGGSTDPSTPLPPDAVTGLSATIDARTNVRLSWPAAPRASRYTVFWSGSPGVDPLTANRLDNVSPPFIHNGLSAGKAYHYVIVAENGSGRSTPSGEVSAVLPPAAPIGVTVTAGDATNSLAWPPSTGAFAYRIWWSNSAGVNQDSAEFIEVVAPSLTHSGLANGLPHYYIVTAIGAGGEGPPSNELSATPAAPLPTAPRSVSAMVNSAESRSVILKWLNPEVPLQPRDVIAYRVYRSLKPLVQSKPAEVSMIAETSATSFTDSVPINGVAYYYVVTALTMSGEGSASSEVSARPEEAGLGNDDGSGGSPGGVFDCGEPTHCWQLAPDTPSN